MTRKARCADAPPRGDRSHAGFPGPARGRGMTGRCAARAPGRAGVRGLLLVAALMLPVPMVVAEDAGRFAGFDAVAVGCSYRSGQLLLPRLSEALHARIGLAAARANVRLLRTPDNETERLRRRAAEAGAAILACELSVTAQRGDAPGRPAVHVRLALGRHYAAAVEAERGSGPGSIPRAGWLELWAQDIIAAGPRDSLVEAVARAVGRLADNAFAAYREGGGAAAAD